jgi:hypothetical protein
VKMSSVGLSFVTSCGLEGELRFVEHTAYILRVKVRPPSKANCHPSNILGFRTKAANSVHDFTDISKPRVRTKLVPARNNVNLFSGYQDTRLNVMKIKLPCAVLVTIATNSNNITMLDFVGLALKMEAICSSETLMFICKSKWRYNPLDQHRHVHLHENLRYDRFVYSLMQPGTRKT